MFPEPHEIALAAPAAGQGFAYQVGGAYLELPLALSFQLVTSAVVANRHPLVSYLSPGGQTLARVVTPLAQAAGITGLYSFALGWPSNSGAVLAAGTVVVVQLAIVPLRPGGQLVVSVDAIDAGDVISQPMLTVARRSLAGNDGHGERLEVDLVQAPAPVGGPAGAL